MVKTTMPTAATSPTSPTRDDLLQDILQAAEQHGNDSDPDHEVGDLQDALRLAWAALTTAQREHVHRDFFAEHDRA